MDNSTSQSFVSTYSNIGTKVIFSNIDTSSLEEKGKLMKMISENNDPSIFIILNKNSSSNKFDEIILYDPFYTPPTNNEDESTSINEDESTSINENESYINKLSIFKAVNIEA